MAGKKPPAPKERRSEPPPAGMGPPLYGGAGGETPRQGIPPLKRRKTLLGNGAIPAYDLFNERITDLTMFSMLTFPMHSNLIFQSSFRCKAFMITEESSPCKASSAVFP